MVKRADFAGEFITETKVVNRPIVTVNRCGDMIANKEKDLIVCGNCGSLMSHKAKYCMGCGAKFLKIKNKSKYLELEAESEGQIVNQLTMDL